jgi:glutaminyl-peptide cyclotransferase
MIRPIRAYSIEILLVIALAASMGFFGYLGYGLLESSQQDLTYSGERALGYVERQLTFGPRITGTESHKKMGDWLIEELRQRGWDVVIQPFRVADDVWARNIVAIRGEGPVAILGAHYDTRMYADEDPDPQLRSMPVPGANDGASGVAVLLELARTLDVKATGHTVCLTFFDAEDNGRIPGWDWIMGSSYFVEHLPEEVPRCNPPRFAVIVDMIGDADQQVYLERTSTPGLRSAIWTVAEELGYGEWIINELGYSIIDDHTPFLEAGIPAVDMIDFDYPYWHTTQDTLDKISADSLERIGRTLEVWLELGAPFEP